MKEKSERSTIAPRHELEAPAPLQIFGISSICNEMFKWKSNAGEKDDEYFDCAEVRTVEIMPSFYLYKRFRDGSLRTAGLWNVLLIGP